MRVVVTDAALDDLLQIGRYIAQDNPVRAASFVEELYAGCPQLGETPLAFPS
jgi:plasmid stabilization system protein ParE